MLLKAKTFFFFLTQCILYIRAQSGKPIVQKEGSCCVTEEKKEEQLYNEVTQMLCVANNYILHLDVNCL